MVSGICAIVVEGFVDVWLVEREWLGGLVVGRLLDWKSLQAMLKCRRQQSSGLNLRESTALVHVPHPFGTCSRRTNILTRIVVLITIARCQKCVKDLAASGIFYAPCGGVISH